MISQLNKSMASSRISQDLISGETSQEQSKDQRRCLEDGPDGLELGHRHGLAAMGHRQVEAQNANVDIQRKAATMLENHGQSMAY